LFANSERFKDAKRRQQRRRERKLPPALSVSIPLAEQFRRRFAKPQRLVRFQHGIPIQGSRQNEEFRIIPGAKVSSFCIHHARPFFRDANTGDSQDFTGLVAAVQLRHRVAFGLQALQRCSGPLNRRARGSTILRLESERTRGFQAKDVLHRLGEGGLSPNRIPSYGWQALICSTHT
jgi:hypothetical protein